MKPGTCTDCGGPTSDARNERCRACAYAFRRGAPVLKRRALSADQERECVDMYEAGMGSPSIARRLGVAKRTVLLALHRHGVTMRSGKPPSIPRPICADCGRTCRAMRAERCVPCSNRANGEARRLIDVAAIEGWYGAGASGIDIAATLGVSASAVYNAFRREGVAIRTQGMSMRALEACSAKEAQSA